VYCPQNLVATKGTRLSLGTSLKSKIPIAATKFRNYVGYKQELQYVKLETHLPLASIVGHQGMLPPCSTLNK
jgi:hypothetical protein